VVVFLADADQVSALIFLANYDFPGVDNVFAPLDGWLPSDRHLRLSGCSERSSRAVLDLTDLSARENVRHILGKDVLTFALPYRCFQEREKNVEGSFLERNTWRSLVRDLKR
jgi:hypothetical protein